MVSPLTVAPHSVARDASLPPLPNLGAFFQGAVAEWRWNGSPSKGEGFWNHSRGPRCLHPSPPITHDDSDGVLLQELPSPASSRRPAQPGISLWSGVIDSAPARVPLCRRRCRGRDTGTASPSLCLATDRLSIFIRRASVDRFGTSRSPSTRTLSTVGSQRSKLS